jgi:hypothetical protein
MALAIHQHAGSKTDFSEMIPREILKKIRQSELRTARSAFGSSSAVIYCGKTAALPPEKAKNCRFCPKNKCSAGINHGLGESNHGLDGLNHGSVAVNQGAEICRLSPGDGHFHFSLS